MSCSISLRPVQERGWKRADRRPVAVLLRTIRIGSRIGKRLGVVLAAGSAALALVGVAGADQYQVRLTAAGNAAARAAVVARSDLGSSAAWTGVSKKPDLSSSPTCAGFDPKESDLVIVGAAETDWKHPGLEFDSLLELRFGQGNFS